ncbi:DUF1854 domain-containing protein [Paenibacillus dokdonensis]|uniref:DUF1854 domain-containing protein n=2 Tax=Paenibacillus dokdonensis TaxID=2567944 RepID=A0ABU6GUK5_9BACL|nr:DUF1854 domain-containing protein [Paenibacillus dokdonensis]MEC0242817.1 DUF1854 domain-containing protein [Paenibacillus dokdonensis]
MQTMKPNQSDLSVAASMNYLTADNTTFTKTEGQILMIKVNDEEHQGVYLHCSFPHTNNRIYISIRTGDNKEIGIIKSLDDDFPKDVVSLLEEQIKMRYFAPEITRLTGIKEEFGYSYWDAETNSGNCQFTVRNGGGNVKLVTERKLLIIDVYGNRFVIEDIKQLSEKEYRLVEMYI